MKIAKLEAVALSIPFSHGGAPAGWGGRAWTALDMVLLRVETDDGIVGWGDAFSYNCRAPVQAVVETMLAPIVVGREATQIPQLMHQLQRELHLFGRYGLTLFALSGLDIALWDIAGKSAGLPLHRLLGGAHRPRIPGYASLFKYRDPELVAERSRAALAEGYRHIKLHETEEPEVAAARAAVGPEVAIMLDTNCPWTPVEARERARRLKAYELYWLEEPIFPPENFEALARLQRQAGIPIAAGENASTAFEFQKMFAAEAVTYAQPSVTKVGGITEFLKIAALAEAGNVTIMPHSPYFGPGWLATLHLLSALPNTGLAERFYLSLEASPMGGTIDPVEGHFPVPEGPGLGVDPDPDVIKSYAVPAS